MPKQEKVYDFLIVTPVLNAKEFIQDCIESVKTCFGNSSYCHVIVDGGSNDGTLEVIKGHDHEHLCLMHHPKSSMYEAINFGLKSKKAKYFYQLNADDLVLPHAPIIAKKLLDEDAHLASISGATLTVSITTSRCRTKFSLSDQFSNKRVGCNLFINQPSTFVRYNVLIAENGFDEKYRYASDTELWLRLINKNYKFKVVDEIFSIDRLHKGSARLLEKHIKELDEVRFKYYGRNKNLFRKFSNSVFYSAKQLMALVERKGEIDQTIKYIGPWYLRMGAFFMNSKKAALEFDYSFFKGRFRFWGRLN